jgi:hypothetical protein
MPTAVATLVVRLAALIPGIIPVQASETFTGSAPDRLGDLSPNDCRITQHAGLQSSEHRGTAS